jgi:hypothetical protein
MHPTIHVLICTQNLEAELSLQRFAENHPDVSAARSVDTWAEALDASSHYDLLFLDAAVIPTPEDLNRIQNGASVILLAADPNDCRRFKGTRVRSCLIMPVSLESFQWTIRSVQPMYAEEMA